MKSHRRLLRAVFACCFIALVPMMLGCGAQDNVQAKSSAQTTQNDSSTAGATDEREQSPKLPASDRLVGTWNLSFVYDEDSAKAFLELENIRIDAETEQQIPKLVAAGQSMKISREWRADGTTTLTVGGDAAKREIIGAWKIASESGDVVQVEIMLKGRRRAETYEVSFQSNDAYVPTKSPALEQMRLKSATFRRSR